MTQHARKKSLAERKAELQARLSQIEARERDARRKEATRSRILLGGALLSRATKLVQQRDAKAGSFLRFLRELSTEISRPADAPAKAAIEQLLAGMESELVKPRLAEQSSLSAAPKAAQPPPAATQRPQEPAQPSPASTPTQRLQAPQAPLQKPLGAWSKPQT